MPFTSLGLAEPLVRALTKQGYTTPTDIQKQAIPVVLKGLDLLASAATGTGKTAGFTLPLLHRLSTQERAGGNQAKALILAPTRELAAQIQDSIMLYGQYLPIRSTAVFGGVKINPQLKKLRSGVEILVATPGRLLDLYQQNAIRFDQLHTLILDEADRMLDMGFINDIKRIITLLPAKRQTLMFSATLSNEIRLLAKALLKNPMELSVTPNNTAAVSIAQQIHPVDKARKTDLLVHLIQEENWTQALVFSKTKHGANKLVKSLKTAGIDTDVIHGNKTQAQRMKALADFKRGKTQILVATDVAARGIDVNNLPMVVNFDLPTAGEDYIHRIGRTGRAGITGRAISLVSADEIKHLFDIERCLKKPLLRVEVEGFEPLHALPTFLPRSAPKRSFGGGQHRSGGRSSEKSKFPPRGGSRSNNAPFHASRRTSAPKRQAT